MRLPWIQRYLGVLPMDGCLFSGVATYVDSILGSVVCGKRNLSQVGIQEGERLLKREFCRDLHEARSRCTFDLAEARVFSLPIDRCWAVKLSMIECVECLGSDSLTIGERSGRNIPMETAPGRAPEDRPIRFSMSVSDPGVMHAMRERHTQTLPP